VTGGRRDVAEEIAVVVADLRAGRVQVPGGGLPAEAVDVFTARVRAPQPVVDVTAIYRSMAERVAAGVNLYEDFPSVVSPWDEALICYVNQHGNVIVLQASRRDWQPRMRWDTDNDVDWDRVRWLISAVVWVGGRGGDGRPVPTAGPTHLMEHAVYDDGSPADLHWQQLIGGRLKLEVWEMPTLVLNAAFNFLSCTNVEVAEPVRAFPVRRRLRRHKVTVQTIVVRPPGKRTAAAAFAGRHPRPVDDLDTPLTSVRGTFAHYGPQWGAGLLFGKYSGKFWRPPYVRGQRGDDGADTRDYLLKP
jgi:hypothetical protein